MLLLLFINLKTNHFFYYKQLDRLLIPRLPASHQTSASAVENLAKLQPVASATVLTWGSKPGHNTNNIF